MTRLLIIYLISCLLIPFSLVGQTSVELNDNRELFVDDYFIDKLYGVEMKMHSPVDEGAVLYFDEPWEGPFCGYTTMIKDNDVYRLYYRGLPEAGKRWN
jgi:hypothetical protein